MKIKKSIFIILMLLISLFLLPVASAQTGSLAVWENIADGTLTSTWSETSNGNWQGINDTVTGWGYECNTTSYNWTYNDTIKGSRWMKTWEATSNDAETGIGSAMFIDETHYYAVVYYLSFNGGEPALYLLYNDAGEINYWNSTGWETNRSNATDYTQLEKDYFSDFIRFKVIWNWNETDTNDCTVRFKAWEPSGDEIVYWLCDDTMAVFPGDTATTYYPGLVVDGSWDLDESQTIFRRIWFWNLSYTMTDALNHVITCPTESMVELATGEFADAEDEDIWNTTQLYKDFINLFDLTSMYNEQFWNGLGDTNQNDTVYHFSLMLTDFDDFFEAYFPSAPEEIPDNALMMATYLTIDGTSNASDAMLVRIDTDNDQVYEATDYAFWTDDTNTYAYRGWTLLSDEETTFLVMMNSGASTGSYAGEIYRDAMYYVYSFVLNWDMMYNGSSGERIGTDQCRMSISWHDADTDALAILNDFYPANDDDPYIATEIYNTTRDPVFEEENATTFWTLFQVDEGLSGEPLSDPEDPPAPYTPPSESLGWMGDISKLILELVMVFIALGLIYFIVNDFLNKKKRTIADMVDMFKMILLVVIFFSIIGALIALF